MRAIVKTIMRLLNFMIQCVDRVFNEGDTMKTFQDEVMTMFLDAIPNKIPTTPHQDAIMQKVRFNSGIAVVQDKGTAALLMGPKMLTSDGMFISSGHNPQFKVDVIILNANADNAYWYSVLFHELAHASGTKERLCRMGVAGLIMNPIIYAVEEIIAEMAAMRVMEHVGLATDETRAKSNRYIACYENSIKSCGAMPDVIQIDSDISKAESMVMNWLQGIEFKAA